MLNLIVDVICDVPCCGNWVEGNRFRGHSPEVTLGPERLTAASQGWTRLRTDRHGTVDLCPDCSRKLAEGKTLAGIAGPAS